MTSDALTLPLLEFLQYKAGCTYLSDLKSISGWEADTAGPCAGTDPGGRGGSPNLERRPKLSGTGPARSHCGGRQGAADRRFEKTKLKKERKTGLSAKCSFTGNYFRSN